MIFLSYLYGWLKSNKELLLLGLIIAIGSFLRIYNLGTESLWLDESISVDFSSGSIGSIIAEIAGRNNPPLYWIILHFWIKLFGTSEAAIRSISAIFGILAIFVTYLVGRELFNRRVGLIASLISAVSYFHVYYSQEARPYALLLLLSLLSFLFFTKILKHNKNWYYPCYFISIVLLGYTHIYGLFVIASQPLIFFMLWYKYKPQRWRLIITWTAAFVSLIPLVMMLGTKTANITENGLWIQEPSIHSIVNTIATFSGYGTAGNILLLVFFILVLIALIFDSCKEDNWIISKYLTTLGKTDWKSWLLSFKELLLLAIWLWFPILVPYIISLVVTPIFVTRYTMGASSALYLLVARGIDNLSLKKFIYPTLMIITLISGYGLYNYYVNDVKEQWREAANIVELQSQPNDVLIFCSPGVERPFNYYFKGNLKEFMIGRSVDDVQVMSDFIDKTIDGKDRVWLIMSHGGQTAPFRDYMSDRFGNNVVSETKLVGVEILLVDLKQVK